MYSVCFAVYPNKQVDTIPCGLELSFGNILDRSDLLASRSAELTT
jgi:hypothetical protein